MASLAADSGETRQLVERLRAGDRAAREELFTRHRNYLARFVELRLDARVRSRVDASDVVQEAQLEAVRRLDNYVSRPAMPFRLWLRQIAFDRLLMLQRQHLEASRRSVERDVRLPDRSSMMLAQQLFSAGPSPSEQMLKREFARGVSDAVAQLQDADREIILLRNYEGLSNQEVAALLEIESVAASKRYGRALLRLRKVLVENGLMGSRP